jgi:hypothetical protein
MIQRGALVPVPGGFEVFLRALEPRELDLAAPEKQGLLTTRQRQAFAHEIAHTLFYRDSDGKPAPTGQVKNSPELERICDRTGWHLLVPTGMLQKEIRKELGDSERIDIEFIHMMKGKFNVSYEVTVERVRIVESQNGFARCILVARKGRAGARMTASYFGVGIFSIIPELATNESLLDWFPEFPREAVERSGAEEWEVSRKGHRLLIRKLPAGRRGDFLLQVDDIARMAPSSRRT